jgi:hypothetical protein
MKDVPGDDLARSTLEVQTLAHKDAASKGQGRKAAGGPKKDDPQLEATAGC